MKGQRIPDETKREACEYAQVHGDDAASAKYAICVNSLRVWRKQFGFPKRSTAPRNPRNGRTKAREIEFFED